AGPERVVLVRLRHTEHGHDRVADELLHRSAVRLDDPLHPLEVPGQQRPQRLRIGRLAELGRAGQVAEQHRHRLTLLSAFACERRSAMRAERRRAWEFLSASGTSRHRASLRRYGAEAFTLEGAFSWMKLPTGVLSQPQKPS